MESLLAAVNLAFYEQASQQRGQSRVLRGILMLLANRIVEKIHSPRKDGRKYISEVPTRIGITLHKLYTRSGRAMTLIAPSKTWTITLKSFFKICKLQVFRGQRELVARSSVVSNGHPDYGIGEGEGEIASCFVSCLQFFKPVPVSLFRDIAPSFSTFLLV
jgi:hypothetical protein